MIHSQTLRTLIILGFKSKVFRFSHEKSLTCSFLSIDSVHEFVNLVAYLHILLVQLRQVVLFPLVDERKFLHVYPFFVPLIVHLLHLLSELAHHSFICSDVSLHGPQLLVIARFQFTQFTYFVLLRDYLDPGMVNLWIGVLSDFHFFSLGDMVDDGLEIVKHIIHLLFSLYGFDKSFRFIDYLWGCLWLIAIRCCMVNI